MVIVESSVLLSIAVRHNLDQGVCPVLSRILSCVPRQKFSTLFFLRCTYMVNENCFPGKVPCDITSDILINLAGKTVIFNPLLEIWLEKL